MGAYTIHESKQETRLLLDLEMQENFPSPLEEEHI